MKEGTKQILFLVGIFSSVFIVFILLMGLFTQDISFSITYLNPSTSKYYPNYFKQGSDVILRYEIENNHWFNDAYRITFAYCIDDLEWTNDYTQDTLNHGDHIIRAVTINTTGLETGEHFIHTNVDYSFEKDTNNGQIHMLSIKFYLY